MISENAVKFRSRNLPDINTSVTGSSCHVLIIRATQQLFTTSATVTLTTHCRAVFITVAYLSSELHTTVTFSTALAITVMYLASKLQLLIHATSTLESVNDVNNDSTELATHQLQ